MPWPVTHVLIAEKFYPRYFKHLNRKEFILGNCFPDIRYPARIERDRTHIKNIPLSTIQSATAFRAGVLFHSMVDGLWNKHVHHHAERLFSELPHDQPMIHTAKILQDKFIYAKSDHWDQIAASFSTILPEEHTYGASEAMVERWHAMLAHYLSKPPELKDLNMLALSLAPDMLDKISEYCLAYQENPTLKDIMVRFYEHVETLIVDS